MMEAIHLNEIGFDLFITSTISKLHSQGVKVMFGKMNGKKIAPIENGEMWDVIKVKYPDEDKFRFRTLEQLRGDFDELKQR
ncbi:MAG: hypothetical protein PHV04_09635 [Clostridia bacterium]|jgi:hypothetical protein|nr:hypothetical protein [Clostridia bacterium]